MDAYPPISDYGLLSDCESLALVAPSGGVEWLCVPRMDSPSVFGALLDRRAGSFRFGAATMTVPAARRYLPGTMVVETTWAAEAGRVVVRDALLIGASAEHVLARTVRCMNGEVEVALECEPRFDYGERPGRWSGDGGHDHEAVVTDGSGGALRLTTDLRIEFDGPRAVARTSLRAGEVRFCALSWGEADPPRRVHECSGRLARTIQHWQRWLAGGEFPGHPWRPHLERSALTLKGLTYAPTGALVAAATTSLPETLGGDRNWDYRYSWIRDSAFALGALSALGFDAEADDYFAFIVDLAERDAELQIMYGIDGTRELTERVLTHLEGYAGSGPVRVGNGAHVQRQHDVLGAAIEAVYLHAASREHLDERSWLVIKRHVEFALDYWREPDRGIWEVRGEPQHFTSSKVMCWVAVDRAARLARLRGELELAATWRVVANEIHADVCRHGVDGRAVFTQHYDTDALDASVLLIPLTGFLPPHDPRVIATVRAIADELTDRGLVLRYRTKETDDGLTGEEGTFTICSFWLVSALVAIGELAEARQRCEQLLSLAGPLGLYAEELDPRSGRHLGNYPQAFTHLALINAAMHVIRAEQSRHASSNISATHGGASAGARPDDQAPAARAPSSPGR
jgi:alpha,alpha-trehalase